MLTIQDALPRNSEPLNLTALVSEFYQTNLPDMEASGVSFSLNIPSQPCITIGDRRQLWRVLENIVYNALEFTPIDGLISMTLKLDPLLAVLKITDTGSGISPHDLPHIFDRFFSRRQERSGSGLGLYMVRTIVHEHGGEIIAKSCQGEGTSFMIQLPRYLNQK